MGFFSKALHHQHVRKRVHKNLETYPHPDKFKYYLDKVIYIVGLLTPILTLPQVYSIYAYGSAEGVSLLSWSYYSIAAIIWILYGVIHKEKPIILTYSFMFIVDILIVIGILLY